MNNDTSHSAGSIKPTLARVSIFDVPDGGAISLDLTFPTGRQGVILTRRGEVVAAFLNRCPHARWPLDTFDGRFLFTPDGGLICAAHSAVFDPQTGGCLGGAGQGDGLTVVHSVRDGDDVVLG